MHKLMSNKATDFLQKHNAMNLQKFHKNKKQRILLLLLKTL